jgi:hypothetical protein
MAFSGSCTLGALILRIILGLYRADGGTILKLLLALAAGRARVGVVPVRADVAYRA